MNTARQVVIEELDREIERLEELEAEQLAQRLGLPEWGYWARCFDPGVGYAKPPFAFEAKGWDVPDLRQKIPRIPDDEAVAIDRAIADLEGPYRRAVESVYLYLSAYRSLSRREQKWLMVGVGKLSMVLPERR